MQTTLLGLAIAFILALLAALIGPYFVDWNQFRPQFEAEASQVIGVPVRVAGALDARLLPTPTLRLRQVTFGGANDLGKLRADKLDVEFSLGDLMRGEWRANELTVSGMAADLGLDPKGRVDLAGGGGRFNLAALSIDRLNLTGRVALHDAVSHSTLELTDIVFSGDVRSLAGSLRGDGAVSVLGVRYPFRVSSSQDKDSSGLRVHLNIDPGERPVAADVEGLISFANRSPRFAGALTLSSPPPKGQSKEQGKAKPVDAKDQAIGDAPWRMTAKVAADPSVAKLDQIEFSFGREERALKFAGNGDVRFGAAPLLRAALSARRLDADRLLGIDGNTDRKATVPAQALPELRNWLARLPTLPLPADIQISTEQITLAGRPVQDFSARLHNEPASWSLEQVDLKAPGATHLTFRTAGASAASTSSVSGALDLDSADPDALVAWLQGRTETSYRSQRPLRLRGNVNIGSDRVAIESLKAEMDSGAVEGRMALITPSSGAGSRFEAALKGERLDVDAATALARSLAGSSGQWPDEASIAIDVGRATWSGQDFRPFTAKASYGPKSITVDQVKFSQGGVTSEGSGRFDRTDATGRLSLTTNAASLHDITALLQPFAPNLAAQLEKAAVQPGPARFKLALDLARDPASADRAQAKAVLDLEAPQIKGTTTLTAKPAASALRNFDLDAISRTDVGLDAKISAEQGNLLLALLGVNRIAAAGSGPAVLDADIKGNWRAPLRVTAKIAGVGLDGDVQGTLETTSGSWSLPAADLLKANLNLRVRNANLAPLAGFGAQAAAAQNARLFARVGLVAGRLSLDDIDGLIGGARLRGRLALTLDDDRQIDGELGLDALNLPQMFALVVGATGHDAAEPLGPGFLKGWRGRVSFQALSAALPGGGELRPIGGTIKSDGQSLTVENLKGRLGGGDVAATLDARPNANGLALSGRLELSNVDGNALHYRSLAMPAGRISAQMALASEGRSVQALTSAFAGNGTVTLDGVSIPGLDPRAFDVALRAFDAGQITDDVKLRQIVEPLLTTGSLAVASAQIPFVIRDGRLRVSATTLDAKDARAIVSGGYDIPADQADIRASLITTTIGNESSRPEIQLFVVGTPDGLQRSVDVTSLSSWLAVRAIDRETRRLDAIARGEPPPSYPSSTASLPSPSGAGSAPPSLTDVPVPGRDPRRTRPGGPRQQPPPQPPLSGPPPGSPPLPVPPVAANQQVAPLPPPVEVKPPPGALPPRPKPMLRPPLVLTPPGSP
ncbi:AsmA family protein [Bradyrhizobium sp. SZCCHNS1054]|uniref:AsmA family protein n=1 Tax=Bradyrhizobium sp. SZCCHNS1054 TaxID=3057301 RepID=UPI00291668EB|nr:AsmA family protein [Bradyrhizobium sp. SZCCHNS1054]